MRVLEVIGQLSGGGAETALWNRLALREAGVTTGVLTHGLVASCSEQGTEADCLPEVMLHPNGINSLPDVLVSFRPDVIVCHTPRSAITCLRRETKTMPPVVVVAHNEIVSDSWSRRIPISLMLNRWNKKAVRHIAVSNNASAGSWCHGAQHVDIVPLGAVDTPHKSRQNDEPIWPPFASVKLLTLSRLISWKRVDQIIRAVDANQWLMRDKSAFLIVVGSGPLEHKLNYQVEVSGLGDLVRFVGWSNEPQKYLALADWLLVASRYEGGPLTAMESVLMGCRVAGHGVGVMPDLALHLPHAVKLTDERSQGGLTRLLGSVLVEPPLDRIQRKQLVEAAQPWHVRNCAPSFYSSLRASA